MTIHIPATALLHIRRNDYVLLAVGENRWRVTEVNVGEVRNEQCEVLHGLKDGDHIISRGAILLKTLAAQALTTSGPVAESP
jgi:hypothetical protein